MRMASSHCWSTPLESWLVVRPLSTAGWSLQSPRSTAPVPNVICNLCYPLPEAQRLNVLLRPADQFDAYPTVGLASGNAFFDRLLKDNLNGFCQGDRSLL